MPLALTAVRVLPLRMAARCHAAPVRCVVMGGQGARRKRNWRHNQFNSPVRWAREAAKRELKQQELQLRAQVLPLLGPERGQAVEQQLKAMFPQQRVNLLRRVAMEQKQQQQK
ncbi:hypothetical protein TSOC_000008 [Tetrabaena socialis]|uniref:Uncharacterized protein n=1 Tax=Tetrabaena socialis TaxID=47790 RepID=A0A2J8AKF4_9CHLO|nr:hypothetical protein TSOC_000008 [Tetrabaena socialis]|eukprot:PNH13001.1 hypothetical protein TSOC_000008 [Tetrabaena socialis]